MVKHPSKDAPKAKDGSSSKEDVPGPKAILTTIISKVKPQLMSKKEADPIQDAELSDKEVRQLIAENPQMSASTFYNLLKSKGCQISKPVAIETEGQKQADSGSAFPQVLRGQKEGPKFDSCVDQVKKKGDVDNPYAVCAASLGTTKESKFKIRSNRFLESVKAQVEGVDGNPRNEIVGFTKFKVVLLQEGMGNFRDSYWYSKEALTSAVPVFEGAKIYADHPSAIDESTRPERTVRDILGNFEEVHLEEGDGGQTLLVGSVNILADDSYRWARSLMEHAVEFSKKYPDKDFVGLSINADGDASEILIDDLISAGVPEATLPKLQRAKQEGIDTVRVVSTITSATSCDLVTEAGAGGKILNLLEGDSKMEKKEMDQQDPSKLKAEADGGEMPHSDEQQDIELIKKMIKQYMGEEVEASEEECGVVKEAYEAHKEMGEEEDEAQEKAVGHLKLAKHLAAKKEKKHESEVEDETEDEAKKESEKKEDEAEGKHKEAMISLKAENAKLRESLRKIEINNHVDSLCEKSKLPKHITKAFREAIGTPKSVEEVNKSWKLFEAGLKKADDELGGFAGLIITPEKTTSAVGKKSLFDGVIKE